MASRRPNSRKDYYRIILNDLPTYLPLELSTITTFSFIAIYVLMLEIAIAWSLEPESTRFLYTTVLKSLRAVITISSVDADLTSSIPVSSLSLFGRLNVTFVNWRVFYWWSFASMFQSRKFVCLARFLGTMLTFLKFFWKWSESLVLFERNSSLNRIWKSI